jgi:hypothetical protein
MHWSPPLKRTLALATLIAACLVVPAHAAPGSAPVTGQVLAPAQAGGYTYLRLKTASGEVWAAVSAAEVAKGSQVTIVNPMTMENFESKSLKKTFDRIVFGQLSDPKAKSAAPSGGLPAMAMATPGAGAAPPQGSPHGATAPATAKPVAKVAKADGPEGRTVAEVITGKAKLKDKTVAVRGQVVKVSAGIMGKNWVHLQDGSGSASDGSNDLLVTTQDKPAVGDVVQARGTVRTDVNLGAGYNYAVLVEGAVLRK